MSLDIKVNFALAAGLFIVVLGEGCVRIPRIHLKISWTNNCANYLIHYPVKVVLTERLPAFADVIKLEFGGNSVGQSLPNIFSLHLLTVALVVWLRSSKTSSPVPQRTP